MPLKLQLFNCISRARPPRRVLFNPESEPRWQEAMKGTGAED